MLREHEICLLFQTVWMVLELKLCFFNLFVSVCPSAQLSVGASSHFLVQWAQGCSVQTSHHRPESTCSCWVVAGRGLDPDIQPTPVTLAHARCELSFHRGSGEHLPAGSECNSGHRCCRPLPGRKSNIFCHTHTVMWWWKIFSLLTTRRYTKALFWRV